MNRFDQAYHSFPEPVKKKIPVNFNFIYRFNKRGVVKKKGDAYYGVPVKILNTPQFYTWGHNKSISKILDLTAFTQPEKKEEIHEPLPG